MEKDPFRTPFRPNPHPFMPPYAAGARRPLIDFAKNPWTQNSSSAKSLPSGSYSPPTPSRPRRGRVHSISLFLRGPKLRRYVVVYIILLCLAWGFWTVRFSPARREQSALAASLLAGVTTQQGRFGLNARPDFADFEVLKRIDREKMPLTGYKFTSALAKEKKRRLIVIGDIHGCVDELQALLQKLDFDPTTDHIVTTGDMISRGPSSSAVLDILTTHSASCVRGNHEDRILLAHSSLAESPLPLPGPFESPNTTDDDLSENSHSHGDYRARAIAQSLSPSQIEYLQSCPLILSLGAVPGLSAKEALIVHAGLVPGLANDRQDPHLAMNMRTMDPTTLMPSDKRNAGEGMVAWWKIWEAFQRKLASKDREFVIYGHDAREGIRHGRTSIGLDGGCVRGGKLAAVAIEGGKKGVRKRMVTVKCRDYRKSKTG